MNDKSKCQGNSHQADISVVIIFRDDYDLIDQILLSLSEQRNFFIEVVIVDSGKGLDSDSVFERFSSLFKSFLVRIMKISMHKIS